MNNDNIIIHSNILICNTGKIIVIIIHDDMIIYSNCNMVPAVPKTQYILFRFTMPTSPSFLHLFEYSGMIESLGFDKSNSIVSNPSPTP